jgi:hypothetical protein
MSQLGKLVRDYLVGQSEFATQFPGGMSPEQAPPGVVAPYLVYTSSSTERGLQLTGDVTHRVETVSCMMVASTRSAAEDRLAWLADKLKAASWTTTWSASPKAYWWRIDDQSDVSEVVIEGADDSVRMVSFSVIGAISITN